MQVFEELTPVWNWLPAFRAAAESEHLPTAADILGVTPSAVSRTLRQLEDALGHRLFERVGRRIRLNDTGRDLLTSVRNGMRQIHGGFVRVGTPAFARKLRIAGSGLATLACAVPMMLRLLERFPEMTGYVDVREPQDMIAALRQGDIDLGLLSKAIARRDLECRYIGDATNGLYCHETHPLAGSSFVDITDLGDHAFVAPLEDELGNTSEGWPQELPRRVHFHAAQMHVGAEACKAGTLLAVLPDYIGRLHGLTRLTTTKLDDIPVFAVYREPLSGGADYSILLRALSEALADAGGRPHEYDE